MNEASRIPDAKTLQQILDFMQSNAIPDDNLINVKSVAEKLGVSVDTVWKHTSAGLLPLPIKLGKDGKGATRWRRSEINQYIANLQPQNDDGIN